MNERCKNGSPRKGKATITARRLQIRDCSWAYVKKALQYHLKHAPQGAQMRMAEMLGIECSQIHRYSCDVCEHDQEPSFSIGLAILLYLEWYHKHPFIDIEIKA